MCKLFKELSATSLVAAIDPASSSPGSGAVQLGAFQGGQTSRSISAEAFQAIDNSSGDGVAKVLNQDSQLESLRSG